LPIRATAPVSTVAAAAALPCWPSWTGFALAESLGGGEQAFQRVGGLGGGLLQVDGVLAQLDGDDAQGLAGLADAAAFQGGVQRHHLHVGADVLDAGDAFGELASRDSGRTADLLGGLLAGGHVADQAQGLPDTAFEVAQEVGLGPVALAGRQVAQAQQLGRVGSHAGHAVIDAGDLAAEVVGHRGQLGAQQAVHEGAGRVGAVRRSGRRSRSPRRGTPGRPARARSAGGCCRRLAGPRGRRRPSSGRRGRGRRR
jgi:hypothetical protein